MGQDSSANVSDGRRFREELPLRTAVSSLEFLRHLKLADLAKNAGLSPFHFQRSFKAVVGVTPKQYLEALRLNNLKEGLRQYGGWLI